jgi:hypothetical protein
MVGDKILGPRFGDETGTGKRALQYRSSRRVTIAARIEADADLSWLEKLKRDFFPDGPAEIKSEAVIQKVGEDHAARDLVRANVAGATIAIVDLSDLLREIIKAWAEVFRIDISHVADPIDALADGSFPQAVAKKMLESARESSLDVTALGRIAEMVADAAEEAGVPLAEKAGHMIIPREAIRAMHFGDIQQLAGRFSLALADALDPDLMEEFVRARLEHTRFLGAGPTHIAIEHVDIVLTQDHVFDKGSQRVLDRLNEGRQRLADLLEALRISELARPASPGRVTEEDSRRIRGLQAADIAAGIAREIFEGAAGDTRARAVEVKKAFRRVLLNDRFVE